jgi:3-dehydroquinate dehydratase-2
MKLIIINGPNLNLLGTRETNVYGNQTFDDYFTALKSKYAKIELSYYQSNVEGELINKLHEVGFAIRWYYSKCRRIHTHIGCIARCHCSN